MIRVGDKVSHLMSFRISNEEEQANKRNDKPLTGTVVWIHPKRRFYVVEFAFQLGNIRECYPMVRK